MPKETVEGRQGGGGFLKGIRELLGLMNMSTVLIVVGDSEVYT